MIPDREHELHRRRRGRNFALGGALGVFVLLVFAVIVVTFVVDLAYAAADPRLRRRRS